MPKADSESSADRLIDMLADEFTERLRKGELPALAEYVERYPRIADEIRELFPALVVMENAVPVGRLPEEASQSLPHHGDDAVTALGDFRIIREIGRGGMGVVYEAEQLSLDRRVALKILPSSLAGHPQQQQRFLRESKAAARLHHTNIVPVFGVGHQDGVHYYVMQYIRGWGLNAVLQVLRESSLPTPVEKRPDRSADDSSHPTAGELASLLFMESASQHSADGSHAEIDSPTSDAIPSLEANMPSPGLAVSSDSAVQSGLLSGSWKPEITTRQYQRRVARIGFEVADALDYAHANGVLHRDIKPGNLLMDRAGTVWIADFGLAKLRDADDLTRSGDFVGTLRYAAPEVTRGISLARSDQFSLGLTLYELLTLAPALDGSHPADMLRRVRECRITPLRQRVPSIPRDLETIIHKTLAPEPESRYRSAAALRDDLKRFLDGEPILARPLNPLQQLARWSARRPALAGTLALSLLAIFSFLVLLAVSRSHLRRERDRTRTNWDLAVARGDELEQRRREAVRSNQMLQESLSKLRLRRSEDLFLTGHSAESLAYLAGVLRESPRNRTVAERLQAALNQQNYLLPLFDPIPIEGQLGCIQFSPDGRRAAVGSRRGQIRIIDVSTGRIVTETPASGGAVRCLCFTPNAETVIAGFKRAVRVWDVESGEALPGPPSFKRVVRHVTVDEQGTTFATACDDSCVRTWDLATGKRIGPTLKQDRKAQFVAFVDSRRLLSASANSVFLWDRASGELLRRFEPQLGHLSQFDVHRATGRIAVAAETGQAAVFDFQSGARLSPVLTHRSSISGIRFGRDGGQVLTASYDSTSRLWNVPSGDLIHEFAHDHQVTHADFGHDGRTIVTASNDTTVRLWDRKTGRLVAEPIKHGNAVTQAQLSPDGKVLLTGGNEALIRAWNCNVDRNPPLILKDGILSECVAFSPDGQLVAAGAADGTTTIWVAASGRVRSELKSDGTEIARVGFSPNGRLLLASDVHGAVQVIDVVSGEMLSRFSHPERVWEAGFNSDGTRLVTACNDGVCRVWDVSSGERLAANKDLTRHVRVAIFNPSDETIFSADLTGKAVLWNALSGIAVIPPVRHGEPVAAAAFHPDGKIVATAGLGRFARMWSTITGAPVGRDFRHGGWVSSVQFSPDGKRVLTTSHDRTARVWDSATGEPVTEPLQHDSLVVAASFSPDGTRLATASKDQATRLWDSETGQLLAHPVIHGGSAKCVDFSPLDNQIAVAGQFGVELYEIDVRTNDRIPAWLPRLAEAIGGLRLNSLSVLEAVSTTELDEIKRIVASESEANTYVRWAAKLLRL